MSKSYYIYKVVKVLVEGAYTDGEWEALCAKYDNRCVRCGCKETLCVDHVIPRIKGGTNYISNIQPLCKRCNSSKGDKTIDYRLNPFAGGQPQVRSPKQQVKKPSTYKSERLALRAENANFWSSLPEDKKPKIVRKRGVTKYIYQAKQYIVPDEMFMEG